jgi:hypothetical protein
LAIAACSLLALVFFACDSATSTEQTRSSGGNAGMDNSAPLSAIQDGLLFGTSRLSSATTYPSQAMGKDYLIDAAHGNCDVLGDLMTFSPDWDSSQQPKLSAAAYCVYGLGLDSTLADSTLALAWAGNAPDTGAVLTQALAGITLAADSLSLSYTRQ